MLDSTLKALSMSSLLLLALALRATAAPADDAPNAIVRRFLSLSQRQDLGPAAAMLTTDAQFGINDIGGPLNAETLPLVTGFYKQGCTISDEIETANRMPERPLVRFVETHWACPDHSSRGTHEMKITWFVQGEKLAGFYLG
jgi:hypothetical protein